MLQQAHSTILRLRPVMLNILFRNMYTKTIVCTLGQQNLNPALICHNINNNANTDVLNKSRSFGYNSKRTYSNSNNDLQLETLTTCTLDNATYERVCTETLNALCDYFEELTENATHINGTDVSYGDGVLTVNLGSQYGTYVINRQTPNKQIWLSSPTSGPKRFDFIVSNAASGSGNGKWIYKHSGETLHELLQTEIPNILKLQKINFMRLPYCN